MIVSDDERSLLPMEYRRLIGDRTALVERLEMTDPDRTGADLPTVAAQVTDLSEVPFVSDETQLTGGGKGETAATAAQAAIGEAVERYAMNTMVPAGAMRRTTYDELASDHRVLDADYLELVGVDGGTVLEDPDEREDDDHPFDRASFKRDAECYWIPGRDLLSGETVFVPAQLISSGICPEYGVPKRWPLVSNGFAAGPTTEFALLRALLEVVERDGIMYSWWTQTEPTPIDVSAFPGVSDLVDRVETPRRDLHLYRLDGKVDLPVVGGSFVNRNDEFPKFLCAGGSALDAGDALRSVVLEMAQCLPETDRMAQKDRDPDRPIRNFVDNVPMYADPDRFDDVQLFTNVDRSESTTLEGYEIDGSETEQLALLLEKLDDEDCTPVALDVTPPHIEDTGITVVRAFVPELLPMSFPSVRPDDHPRLAGEPLAEKPHPFP